MDATGPTARRFPLVARPSPACTPFVDRVAELSERARTVDRTDDPAAAASAVFNSALHTGLTRYQVLDTSQDTQRCRTGT